MPDNRTVDNGALTDYTPACDEVTYSGDTAVIQLVRLVHVTGSEGSKTVSEILFAEDTGHSSGDYGFQMLGVANTANADRSGTTGDYTPISTDLAGNVNTMARRQTVRVSVQSGGLTTSVTAYVAGDQVGNQFTFAGCARASGGTGHIVGVMLVSAADITGAFDLVVTDSSITLAADNAAYAISDSDALKIVDLIQLSGGWDLGNNRIAKSMGLWIPYQCSGGTSLYGGLITRSGHTFFGAATDLQVILYVELD